MKGSFTKMDLGGQKGVTVTQYHSMSITGTVINYSPQQKNHQQERIINYRPQQEKKYIYFIFYKKHITPETQPMRNHHLPKRSLFSDGLFFFFKTTSPCFLLFLHKIMFLSFVIWTCSGFCYRALIWNFNSLLSLNKPLFAGKIVAYFIFKVNKAYLIYTQTYLTTSYI